ncbi:IS3 family transposase, partial [Pectinatus frisingensis]|uniref:IS3 family transposase n=1 Tax=Pectinatus frisingensis TaxID=865 RepID=UPI0018C4C9F7
MTEAIYIEINHKVDELNGKRYVSVSGMLRHLGVSRSGYNAWLVRQPSNQEQRKLFIVDKIQDIYDESHQNYGAPKITQKLLAEGETISERTVGTYMKELGIKAQYVKPYTVTTRDPDFSSQLINILD